MVNKLDDVDNFDAEVQSIQRDILKAARVEKSLKPVASDVRTITEQQKEFKVHIFICIYIHCTCINKVRLNFYIVRLLLIKKTKIKFLSCLEITKCIVIHECYKQFRKKREFAIYMMSF